MDQTTFNAIVVIGGLVISALAYMWVKNLDVEVEKKLAELDRETEIRQERVYFLFRFALEDKGAPGFAWDAWIDEAGRIDRKSKDIQTIEPTSLEHVVMTIRDQTLAKGGVR